MSSRDRLQGSGNFFLITGVGHCGTGWLASVLNRPADGIVTFHQYKGNNVEGGSNAALRHEDAYGIDEYYNYYFRFMDLQLRQYPFVVDSQSWFLRMIPEVDKKIHISRIIHLVRNGIQNVHSHFYHNTAIPRSDWYYHGFLRSYWEFAGKPHGAWEEYSDWGAWCFFWSLNHCMSDWINDNLGRKICTTYRLEDLLNNPDVLRRLMNEIKPGLDIPDDSIRRLQSADINRKIHEDREPVALWRKWTDEQREVFKKICGPTMEKFGYPIPPRP